MRRNRRTLIFWGVISLLFMGVVFLFASSLATGNPDTVAFQFMETIFQRTGYCEAPQGIPVNEKSVSPPLPELYKETEAYYELCVDHHLPLCWEGESTSPWKRPTVDIPIASHAFHIQGLMLDSQQVTSETSVLKARSRVQLKVTIQAADVLPNYYYPQAVTLGWAIQFKNSVGWTILYQSYNGSYSGGSKTSSLDCHLNIPDAAGEAFLLILSSMPGDASSNSELSHYQIVTAIPVRLK